MIRIGTGPAGAAQALSLGLLAGACLDESLPRRADAGADGMTATIGAILLVPPPDRPAPTNLVRVVVEGVSEARVVDEDGVEAPARPMAGDATVCPRGTCAVLELEAPLRAEASYLVEAGAARLEFTTSTGPDVAPPIGVVETSAADGCLTLAVTVDEPCWASAAVGARTWVSPGLAARHELGGSWEGTALGSEVVVEVALVDLAGNRGVGSTTALAAEHPGWAIAEVLANAAGAEPAQEWIELVRVGGEPASLAGLRIGDELGWDELPDVTAPAGARVLVVGSSYDEAAPGDVAAAPGTIVARLAGATIGQSGLGNGGERARLLDGEGTTLSTFTPRRDLSSSAWSGRSLERVRPAGCDLPDNVLPNADGAATPGARNSVEE
jgi:hypothetical protein